MAASEDNEDDQTIDPLTDTTSRGGGEYRNMKLQQIPGSSDLQIRRIFKRTASKTYCAVTTLKPTALKTT